MATVRSIGGAKLKVSMTGTYSNTLDDGSVVSVSQPNLNFSKSLASGTGNDQADRVWQYSGTLRVGEVAWIDVYDQSFLDMGLGLGKDALGESVVMENILAIAIQNDNAVGAAGVLEIEAVSTVAAAWGGVGNHTGVNGLKGQGLLLKYQPVEGGLDVTSATNDQLRLKAVTADVDFSIYIWGRSVDEESSASSASSSSSSSQSASVSSQSTSSSSESSVSSSSSSMSSQSQPI